MEADTCDLGELRNHVIPPYCINTNGKDEDVSSWKITNLPANCEPLIVFINRKSGGGMGEFVIRRLNTILNPSQIFDLSKGGPKPAYVIEPSNQSAVWCFQNTHRLTVFRLTMLAACGVKPYRIMACGGDGTAGWVFQAIDELQLEYRPPLAHLPLGTANDLSRVTGMGPKYSGEDLLPIVRAVVRGENMAFDRWTLDIVDAGETKPTKYFNNYFSVGIDAMIALEVRLSLPFPPAALKIILVSSYFFLDSFTKRESKIPTSLSQYFSITPNMLNSPPQS